MRSLIRRFVVLSLAWLVWPGAAPTALSQAEDRRGDTLTVGVKEAPPFVIQLEDGGWGGIAIDLWQAVAEELDSEYRFQSLDLPELLDSAQSGDIDIAVGALSITREREALVDFSHTYFVSSLGIAVPAESRAGALSALAPLFSANFFRIFEGLVLLLLVFGALIWWFERARNPEQFGGGRLSGLGSGVWWAAVTMTTVGYGDKSPKSLPGRGVAMVWMFASLVLVSLFTGTIASVLTVSGLGSAVNGPEDLPKVRVASVGSAASGDWLQKKRIRFVSYPGVEEALDALGNGAADAAVYDQPILSYLVSEQGGGDILVLPRKFAFNHYGFAMPPDSPLREAVNRAILTHIQRPQWQDTLYRYTGNEL